MSVKTLTCLRIPAARVSKRDPLDKLLNFIKPQFAHLCDGLPHSPSLAEFLLCVFGGGSRRQGLSHMRRARGMPAVHGPWKEDPRAT